MRTTKRLMKKRTKPRGGYEIGGVEKMRLEGLRNNDNKREIKIKNNKRNFKSYHSPGKPSPTDAYRGGSMIVDEYEC